MWYKHVCRSLLILTALCLTICSAQSPAQLQAKDSASCHSVYEEVCSFAERFLERAPQTVKQNRHPELKISNGYDIELGAWAWYKRDENGNRRPIVIINESIVRLMLENNRDQLAKYRVAFVFAHELAHHLLGHIPETEKWHSASGFEKSAFTRELEFQADSLGRHIALEHDIGRALPAAVEALERLRQSLGEWGTLEGPTKDHPRWLDRLAYLDSNGAQYWKAMSAFQDGVHFLELEHYAAAEIRFTAVLSAYPSSAETNANLGLAYLLHPRGVPETKTALRYFDSALAILDRQAAVSGVGEAAVILNTAAANLLVGVAERAGRLLRRYSEWRKKQGRGIPETLEASFAYAQSELQIRSGKALDVAHDRIVDCLRRTSSASYWSDVAYERYREVCTRLGKKPLPGHKVAGKSTGRRYRIVSGVRIVPVAV